MGIVASLLSLLGGRRKCVPLDVQLVAFRQIGIQPASTFDREAMLDIFPLDSLERAPYNSLYSALGESKELEPDAQFCDSIWSFDLETLVEEADYAGLIDNIARISQGELKLGEVKVDRESGASVTVTFSLNGVSQRLTINQYYRWNTPVLLSPINEFARSHGLKGRLAWNRSWGEDWTFGWHTPEQISALKKLGVDIEEIGPGCTARGRS